MKCKIHPNYQIKRKPTANCPTCKKMWEDSKQQIPFEEELRELINRHSLENESDTPDFILAQYLLQCLKTLDSTVKKREMWYGRECGRGGNGKSVLR